jgi:hypothetical protein
LLSVLEKMSVVAVLQRGKPKPFCKDISLLLTIATACETFITAMRTEGTRHGPCKRLEMSRRFRESQMCANIRKVHGKVQIDYALDAHDASCSITCDSPCMRPICWACSPCQRALYCTTKACTVTCMNHAGCGWKSKALDATAKDVSLHTERQTLEKSGGNTRTVRE